jgi:pyridoxamine 5'-phosphate oxidase
MKAFDADGIAFYTNLGSRKARELAENRRACACFHWKTLQRQVIAAGRVERVSDDEADAYFATRPRGSQFGAWASDQSRPLASRADLEGALAGAVRRFEEGMVPRPEFWGGFRLIPDRVEFWQGRPDRLHERLELTRAADGWTRQLLYP